MENSNAFDQSPTANGEADRPRTERLQVTELPQRTRRAPPLPQTEPSQPTRPSPGSEWVAPVPVIESLLKLAGYSLSARALLLLALIGAFVLALFATLAETMMRLYVLIAYCLLVVAPIVGLEIRKR